MAILSNSELRDVLTSAEMVIDQLGGRQRRLWKLIQVPPMRWNQSQYPGAGPVWVVAIIGRKCLYHNHVEDGWGWGSFDSWGEVAEHHYDQLELQHAISMTLHSLEHADP